MTSQKRNVVRSILTGTMILFYWISSVTQKPPRPFSRGETRFYPDEGKIFKKNLGQNCDEIFLTKNILPHDDKFSSYLIRGYQILVQKVFEEICHVIGICKKTQILVHFRSRGFSDQSLSMTSNALKLQFRCTQMSIWHVIINQSIYCRSKLV